MPTHTTWFDRCTWLLVLGAWAACASVAAQTPAGGAAVSATAVAPVGEVAFSRGVGFAQLPGSSPRTLGAGLPLQLGDRLTTATGASAIIKLNDGTRFTLRPQSDVVLQAFKYEPDATDNNMLLQLLRGGFRAITGLVTKNNSKAALVKTPTATIGIRGTDFDARLCQADCATDVRASAEQLRATNLKASAKAVAVTGSIVALSDNGDRRMLVHGSALYPGDLIETASDGRAVLAFRDESKVSLGGGTRFRVDDFVFDRNNPADGRFLATLLKGTARALTGLVGKARASNVLFKTPTATIGIRGTGLDISCDDDACSFFNWLGSIAVTPEGHSALQVLEAGQGLFVSRTGIRPLNQLELPGVTRPDTVDVDPAPLFTAREVDESQTGVYVFVRDGHIELFTDRGTVHLGRGEVGLAQDDGTVLRPLRMPRFLDLDLTPMPNHPNPLLATILGEAGIRPANQCR